VYVCGWERIGSNTFARCWKNGVLSNLNISGSGNTAYSVMVQGTDVYAAGLEVFANSAIASSAVYWKNGTEVQLTPANGNAVAFSIAVNGHDVYVGGRSAVAGKSVATYWKNGIASYFTNDPLSSSAASIALHGDDVYAAGLTWTPANDAFPKCWKNGTEITLGIPSKSIHGAATGIALN
jgi:hypothetical protein